MKFKIYQIDMDRDKNRVKFDNLENTKSIRVLNKLTPVFMTVCLWVIRIAKH